MEGAEKRRTLYSCRGAALHSKVAGYVAAAQNEKIQLWSNILGCIKTQVGSPAVRLRLARCTAWVKRWSEAKDFF